MKKGYTADAKGGALYHLTSAPTGQLGPSKHGSGQSRGLRKLLLVLWYYLTMELYCKFKRSPWGRYEYHLLAFKWVYLCEMSNGKERAKIMTTQGLHSAVPRKYCMKSITKGGSNIQDLMGISSSFWKLGVHQPLHWQMSVKNSWNVKNLSTSNTNL